MAVREHFSNSKRGHAGLAVLRMLALSLTAVLVIQPVAFTRGRPVVVTTVAPLTNIVHNIGCSQIELHGLIPEGSDSHTFEPAPSAARILSKADLVIVNGLHLETPTEKLATATMRPGVPLVKLGESTVTRRQWIFDFSFPESKGDPNPHLWVNPAYASTYAKVAAEALMKVDPPNTGLYANRLRTYRARLEQLDGATSKAVGTIPPANRKLLTYHDSWAYFAPRYGMTVIGAIQPSDFREPSPREVTALIEQIKREKVPAIFGSEVFPSPVMEQVHRETGVRYVTALRDDDLPGAVGTPQHTYIGMMVINMRSMVPALGGSANGMDGIAPADGCR